MMKRIPHAAALMALVTCGPTDAGSQLLIVGVPVPDSQCTLNSNASVFRAVGAYDPTLGEDFSLHVVIENNMESRDEDPSAGFNDQNLRPEMNNATLRGFDACWYRLDTSTATQPGSFSDGLAIRCADLPDDQRRFVPSAGTVEPAGGRIIANADLLTDQDLQAEGVFGPNWDSDAIPAIDYPYDPLSEPPSSGSRSPAWGTFPTTGDRNLRLMVQVRAVASLESGTPVFSNWFTYPVDMCVGCFVAQVCGQWADVICDDAAATPGHAGFIFDPNASCLPEEGFRIGCAEADDCPPS